MNQSFEFSRWLMLVAKHWLENRKKYLLSLIAIAGLMLVWGALVFLTRARGYAIDDGTQLGTYYFGLYVVGLLYASMLFADLASKSKGINYLSLPASHLEKLLCTLFYGTVVFFVVYTLIFYCIDTTLVKFTNAMNYSWWKKTHTAGTTFEAGSVLNVFVDPNVRDGHPNEFFYFLLAYFALQSAFIYGSVYFPKFSFIKTVIALLLFGLFYVFFIADVLHPILPSGSFYRGITSYRIFHVENLSDGGTMVSANDVTDKLVTLPEWIEGVLLFIIKYAFAPIFWIITYHRLKEKEI